MAATDRPAVRIGVFLPSGAQLLDVACVDVFEVMGNGYLSAVRMLPKSVAELAPAVSIFYIGTVQPGEPIKLTAGMELVCTHHLSDPAVQPGELDIVMVPGPDPTLKWGKEVLDWLRGHAARTEKTDILSICTGIYLCGEAGLLKGKKACGPRGLQKELGERFEGVKWVGEELRWVDDGNFWSSGGVTNGNDLVVAYARASRHFTNTIVDLGAKLTDVGDRPQKYDQGPTTFTVGFVWVLLKAWVMGLGKKQKTA